MEILKPQFNSWHINDAYGMEEYLRKTIECVLQSKRSRNLKEYYILVEAHVDPNLGGAIKNTVIILPKKPSPMLGTILYHVNNETGELTRIWVLPRDIPIPEQYLGDVVDNPNGKLSSWNIEDDAKRFNIPIILS